MLAPYRRFKKFVFTSFLKILRKQFETQALQPAAVEHGQIARVLVICEHDTVPEALMLTPVFRALRKRYPTAGITAFVRPHLGELLANNVHIDAVKPVFFSLQLWTALRFVKLVAQIRSKFDLTIVLPAHTRSFTADLLAYVSKARYVLGFEQVEFSKKYGIRLYNLRAPQPDEQMHFIRKNAALLSFIHIETEDLSEQLYVTPAELQASAEFLNEEGVHPEDFIVTIEVGGQDMEHRLLVRIFVEIANYFSNHHDAKIMIVVNRHNRRVAESLINALPFKPVSLENLAARALAVRVSHSNLVICQSLPVIHLAVATKVPLVALYEDGDQVADLPQDDAVIPLQFTAPDGAPISPMKILQASRKLINAYPKQDSRYLYNLDISEQALDNYLQRLDT